jgi:hypothetical protein
MFEMKQTVIRCDLLFGEEREFCFDKVKLPLEKRSLADFLSLSEILSSSNTFTVGR